MNRGIGNASHVLTATNVWPERDLLHEMRSLTAQSALANCSLNAALLAVNLLLVRLCYVSS